MKNYKNTTSSLTIFLVLRFLTCVGDIVPLFTYRILRYTKYYSVKNIGVYETVLCFLYAVLFIVGGRLADAINRKKMLIGSEIFSIIFLLLYFICKTDITLLAAFISVYTIYSLTTPSITTLTLKYSQKDSSTVMSLLTIGMSLSIGFWSIIFSQCKSIKTFLFLILLNNLLVILVSFLGIPAQNREEQNISEEDASCSSSPNGTKDLFVSISKRKYIIVFTMLMIVFMFNLSQLNISIPIMLEDIFPKNGTTFFSIIVCINSLVIITGTYPINIYFKKYSHLSNIILASILYAVGFSILLFTNNIIVIAVSTIIWTAGEIMANIYGNAFIISSAPPEYVGTYISLYSVFSGIGTLLGPLISGFVLEKSTYSVVWLIVVGISLFDMLCLGVLKKQRQKVEFGANNERTSI